MASDRSGTRRHGSGMSDLEHELTLHLERAHELGERMKRSNTAVEEQLRLTRELVVALRFAASDDGG
jgi:signal transduction histidine kinase